MTPEELLNEWTEGLSGMRPQRVQEVRSDLMEHTGLYFPRRISEIEPYVERMKGEVTKRLKAAAEESDESHAEARESVSSDDEGDATDDDGEPSEDADDESEEDH